MPQQLRSSQTLPPPQQTARFVETFRRIDIQRGKVLGRMDRRSTQSADTCRTHHKCLNARRVIRIICTPPEWKSGALRAVSSAAARMQVNKLCRQNVSNGNPYVHWSIRTHTHKPPHPPRIRRDLGIKSPQVRKVHRDANAHRCLVLCDVAQIIQCLCMNIYLCTIWTNSNYSQIPSI